MDELVVFMIHKFRLDASIVTSGSAHLPAVEGFLHWIHLRFYVLYILIIYY